MNELLTDWGRKVDSRRVLPEYPRESLKRTSYINLNGYWEYAISQNNIEPDPYDGLILVPFAPESTLSTVSRLLHPEEILWYRRELPATSELLPEGSKGLRVLLHFGAVDQICVVSVNKQEAGRHTGGYMPFTLDITDLLRPISDPDPNLLMLRVKDYTEESYHARGKQRLNHGGMYYTPVSGIWQTVWMEVVPEDHITGIETVPDIETGYITITVHADRDLPVKILVDKPDIYLHESVSRYEESRMEGILMQGRSNQPLSICIPMPHLWTCEEPWLYPFHVVLGEDSADSYFALRRIDIRKDDKGIPRIHLNNKEIMLRGVLDQGYWPDGLFTAPSDKAILFDLTEIKGFGFNMIRKHVKIEPERWYYHCDRLGLLVWQDLVNGGEAYDDWYLTQYATIATAAKKKFDDKNLLARTGRENPASREEFRKELEETAGLLKNHPCLIAWTIFNEGWGQFETQALTDLLHSLAPQQLIDAASGWFDQDCGDFHSIHNYFFPFRLKAEKTRASVLSEFGGYSLLISDHNLAGNVYGYRKFRSKEALQKDFDKLLAKVEALISKGLCAWVYTQWTDIEDETNGIYTYDRKVRKLIPMKGTADGYISSSDQKVIIEEVAAEDIPVTAAEPAAPTLAELEAEPEADETITFEE